MAHSLPSLDPKQLVYQHGLSELGLAEALGKPYSTVRKWFLRDSSHRRHPDPSQYRLAAEIKDAIIAGKYCVQNGRLSPIRGQ